ncbi:uncharacterized protein PHALS_10991 [Plasmopara halstedii]|uniref:Uncharacterized protein n=1 Tax=Plasmopara halstedii TaxID=4781 RepID=A0A0P1AJV9_PLAHL|nr:uncharacterized protein PHALS_10991 [Plasmopara halstedii]CEG40810.1 hypothetical protein PHALS_10991 [Plasmopara halstedii]|eukprot:XP_024577179.1 hypothetical protein PHALS_10991 [Plasmopara halstedii]
MFEASGHSLLKVAILEQFCLRFAQLLTRYIGRLCTSRIRSKTVTRTSFANGTPNKFSDKRSICLINVSRVEHLV